MREAGISIHPAILLPNALPAVAKNLLTFIQLRGEWEEALLKVKFPGKVINSFLRMIDFRFYV